MRRPVIGVITNHYIDPLYRFVDCPRAAINEAYHRSVIDAGGLPILVPPTDTLELIDAHLDLLDGIVLAGGQDVAPHLYGQVPGVTTEESAPVRDTYELALLDRAHERGLPVLAICRGSQLVNVWRGGTLHQEVNDAGATIDHAGGNEGWVRSHTVTIIADSLLARVLGATEIEVNSFHHQAVDRPGRGLRRIAWAPDGICEAIELVLPDEAPVLAVQWHPEMLTPHDPYANHLFTWLVETASSSTTAPNNYPQPHSLLGASAGR